MTGHITLADVARKAGVSKAAVSAVLSGRVDGSIRVGSAKAAAIRAAAERLGYQPNHAARSLATHKAGAIGFCLSSTVTRGWANPYFAGYLPGAEEACRLAGYSLCISSMSFSEVDAFIRSPIIAQRRIDALIVAGELDPRVYAALRTKRLPFVVLNALPDGSLPVIDPQPHVVALRHLMERGHRRVLMTRDRPLRGPIATVGLDLQWCTPPEGMHPNWEPGFGLGRWLLDHWRSLPSATRPTVIYSNAVLNEVHREMRSAGLVCPQDLQLLSDASNLNPIFTVARVDMAAVGSAAVCLLLAALETGTMTDPAACAAVQAAVTIEQGETTL